ncbi:C-C motif chemokine 1 [Choloepus didactylus]|uniref:C-C motif chemokine 1 n=1 Tax=Choloepus didactylus TaxID=27675 RepID=UPI00189FE250|nr:C-C motif chemokine 1 [Choloepus didactylus]
MQLIATALVCLLLAGMWPQEVDGKSMHVSSSNCCFRFMERKISPQQIHCYRNTSSTCPYGGLIFKLKGGRETCVLKKGRWIQSYLKYIKPCQPKRI